MRFSRILSTVSALAIATAPALAAAPPRSFNPVITPGGSGVSAPLTMPDGAGTQVPFGFIDSVRHLFTMPFAANELNASYIGLNADGVTDDTANLQAAINAYFSGGQGGVVKLDPRKRYLVDSANLTLPPRVTIDCGTTSPTYVYNADYTTTPGLVINSSYTIMEQAGAMVRNCYVMRKGLLKPDATLRTNVNQLAAFAGTAITTSTGSGIAQGHDAGVENVLVLGFNYPFYSSGQQRPAIRHLHFDCLNGPYIDNAHDVPHALDIHGWPYLMVGTAVPTTNFTISAAANNGGGVYRLTLASAMTANNAIVTGDTVYVQPGSGAPGIAGKWTAYVINSTTIDLGGSSVAPSFTGNQQAGSPLISGISSMVGLAEGQTVTGNGITGSATIVAIDVSQNAVYLSANLNGTQNGTTFTVANTAYNYNSGATTGNATVNLDTAIRPGIGLTISNSETSSFVDFFAYGYQICIYDLNAPWTNFANPACDGQPDAQTRYTTGLWVDGSTTGNSGNGAGVVLNGGSINVVGRNILVTQAQVGSSPVGVTVKGTTLNPLINGQIGTLLDLTQGSATLESVNTTQGGFIFIAPAAQNLYLTGNVMPSVRVVTAAGADRAKIWATKNNRIGDVDEVMTNSLLSSCGTGAGFGAYSTKHAGTIQEGTNASGCSVAYPPAISGPSWGALPFCIIQYADSNTNPTLAFSTSNFAVNHTAANNRTFTYQCTER